MIAVALDRLIGYGPLWAVCCRWVARDDEDPEYADREGVWQVWGMAAAGEEWLGTAYDEQDAKAFAAQVGAFFKVPVTAHVGPEPRR